MGLIGSQLESGTRVWRIASIVREGPEWRIILRATDESGDTLTARCEGQTPPTSVGDLRMALARAESRTFSDEAGTRWRVEITPHYENGQLAGECLLFSAERSSDRCKVRHDAVTSLAVVTDGELRKALAWARRAAEPV